MISRVYTPRPPLSNFVESFWYYDGYQLPHAKDRVLPNGSMQLIINLSEDRLRVYDRWDTDKVENHPGSLVCGARSEFTVIDANHRSIMGVSFKAGGAFPFFKLPAGELRNMQVSLDLLWGSRAVQLREELLEGTTPEARFLILERALLEGSAGLWRHPAVAFALKVFDGVPQTRSIGEVTDQIGLSPRRFIQAFDAEVGLTPKLFCRVRRFQEVLSVIGRQKSIDWAAVAAGCGYFDQAHFIHDFRGFSGVSPTTYAASRGDFQNHLALPD